MKGLVGDALVRDNSGSGEAYGGSLDESADFHDHHLYAELHHLPELLDHFAPRWRARSHGFRGVRRQRRIPDPRTLADDRWQAAVVDPADPRLNPQGARWAMEVTGFVDALVLGESGSRADHSARPDQASLLLRRRVFEMVRARDDVSGYVLTGERDTPLQHLRGV